MASKCLWPELPVQVSQPINAFIAPPIPPNCSQISKKDHDYLLVTFSWIFEETSMNIYIFNSHQWLNSPTTYQVPYIAMRVKILPCMANYVLWKFTGRPWLRKVWNDNTNWRKKYFLLQKQTWQESLQNCALPSAPST